MISNKNAGTSPALTIVYTLIQTTIRLKMRNSAIGKEYHFTQRSIKQIANDCKIASKRLRIFFTLYAVISHNGKETTYY